MNDIKVLTIKDLKAVRKMFEFDWTKRVPVYQIYTIPMWKQMRNHTNLCFAKWTDNELNNYNKNTGLIGNKCGVDCYVSIMIN